MKSLRNRYIDYVDQHSVGGRIFAPSSYMDDTRPSGGLFAPLTDGLYAAGVIGTPWVSDVTPLEQVQAVAQCGAVPALVQGSSPDLYFNPALTGLVKTERTHLSKEQRKYEQILTTPVGELKRLLVEHPGSGITVVEDWLDDVQQLAVADWISNQIIEGRRDDAIRFYYRELVESVREHAVIQIQMELPYFLYSLPGFSDKPLMLHMTETERYAASMKLAGEALLRVADLLMEAGVDFIWIGAPGTELLSPQIWEEVVIPQSRRLVEHVHENEGRIHFHCCGQSRLWIDKGYYDMIGMDVVETLSPPPAGNIDDLRTMRKRIDNTIVTRGNIDLELLRTATPEPCATAARDVLQAVNGWYHLVGTADALLYGTPLENLQAVREVCEATA